MTMRDAKLSGTGLDDLSLSGADDDDLIDEIIRNCDNDPRAAVGSLIRIVRTLVIEKHMIAAAAGNRRDGAPSRLDS